MTAFILYVDDDEDMRDIVELALGLDPGLEILACGSGEEALALAAARRPDLILLDAVMPGLDGPATLARLRESPGGGGIPVVFLTARATDQDEDSFRSLGALGIIAKPFDPRRLAGAVRSYLDRPLS